MTGDDIAALQARIQAETDKLAAKYQETFAGDPAGELSAWLPIAARREALVKKVYQESRRETRLPEPRVPAAEVAWDALTLIWQHEAGHTAFIEARLTDGIFKERALTTDLAIWLGTLEGTFLTNLTGHARLTRILTRLAAGFGALLAPAAVPEFALELDELDIGEFYLLCATLEATARQSYARMEALAGQLATQRARDAFRSTQLENLERELALKRLDETFHERAFLEIAGWVVDGKLDERLDPRDCAHRLAELLPRGARAIDGSAGRVLTDGGLGELFRRHQLSIAVG